MATGISAMLTLQDIMAVMHAAIGNEKELAAGNIVIGSQQVVAHLLRAVKLQARVDEKVLGIWWNEVGAQIGEAYRLQLTVNGSVSTVVLPPCVACQQADDVGSQISLGRALMLRLFEDWFATEFKGGEGLLLDTRSIASLIEQADVAVYVITREFVIGDQHVFAMSQLPNGESFTQLLQRNKMLWPAANALSVYQFQQSMKARLTAPIMHASIGVRGHYAIVEPDGTEPPVIGDFGRLANASALTPLSQVPGYQRVSGYDVFEYPLTLLPNERLICVLDRAEREM